MTAELLNKVFGNGDGAGTVFATDDDRLDRSRGRIQEICLGNKDAEAFCFSMTAFAHMIDDCVDGDGILTQEELAGIALHWSMTLAFNPFFLASKASIMGVLSSGINAWVDSEICVENKDSRVKAMADALKSVYSDTLFHVAFLLGGWEHMRAMSLKYRGFDFDNALGDK